MIGSTLQWEATKYGTIVYDHSFNSPYTGTPLRIKIYRYGDKNYIELWEAGIVLNFSEDFNS